MLKNEYPVKVKYIGKTSKLTMTNGKIYEARDCGRGWYALIDETGEEYAYPPHLFEAMDEGKKESREKFVRHTSRQDNPKSDFAVSAFGK
jgi:hypothetical protein